MVVAYKREEMEQTVPRGLLWLFHTLVTEYGADAVDFAPGMASAANSQLTLEISVDADHFDDALTFVSSLALKVEDEYRELYAIAVLPRS